MLGDKDRMAPHGRLFSVVGNDGGSQPGSDKVPGVGADRVRPLFPDISQVLFGEMESGPEGRGLQFVKGLVNGLRGALLWQSS